MAILQLDTHVVDLCHWEDARKVEVLLTWVVHGAVAEVRNVLAVAAALAPLDACNQSKGPGGLVCMTTCSDSLLMLQLPAALPSRAPDMSHPTL